MIKHAIIRSSKKLKNLSITEQGAGVFDLDKFISELQNAATVRPTIYPNKIDLRGNNTYFLPFNR